MLPLLAVAVVVGLWWFSRQSELFVLSVRDGRALVVRGRVPGSFVADASAIVSRGRVKRATIRGVKGGGGVRLAFSGDLSEHDRQRLRNVFSLYPAARLRQAPLIERPTLGQLLGVAWLAWLLDRRS